MHSKSKFHFIFCGILLGLIIFNSSLEGKSRYSFEPYSAEPSSDITIKLWLFNDLNITSLNISNYDELSIPAQYVNKSQENYCLIYFMINITCNETQITEDVSISLKITNHENITTIPEHFGYFFHTESKLFIGYFVFEPISNFIGENNLNFTIKSTTGAFDDIQRSGTMGILNSNSFVPPFFYIVPLITAIGGIMVIFAIILGMRIVRKSKIIVQQAKLNQDDNFKIIHEHEEVMKQLDQTVFKPKDENIN